jgi:hypothetical protein
LLPIKPHPPVTSKFSLSMILLSITKADPAAGKVSRSVVSERLREKSPYQGARVSTSTA